MLDVFLIFLLKYIMNIVKQQKGKDGPIPYELGDSEEFKVFKDQQFFQQRKNETKLSKANRKAIKSLNVFVATNHKGVICRDKKDSVHTINQFKASRAQIHGKKKDTVVSSQKTRHNQLSQRSSHQNSAFKAYLVDRYSENKSGEIRKEEQVDEKGIHIKADQRIRVLKKILEQYHTKTMEPYFKSSTFLIDSDLISKCNFHFNNKTEQSMNKSSVPRSAVRVRREVSRELAGSLNQRQTTLKKVKVNWVQNIMVSESSINHNKFLVQAHGLNEVIRKKHQNRKKANKSANDVPQKNARKVYLIPSGGRKSVMKYQTLPTDKSKYYQNLNDNCISIKVNKFRQFLFIVNFANKVYRELDIVKYEQPFRIFIGRGNNRNLIKAIMKRRFWFQITKNIQDAHFVWTQLKEEDVYKRQIAQFCKRESEGRSSKLKGTIQRTIIESKFQNDQETLEKTKNSGASDEAITEEIHLTSKNIALEKPKIRQKKQIKEMKARQKQIMVFQPETRILTKQQFQGHRQLMKQIHKKKKNIFTDRLSYLKSFSIIQQNQSSQQSLHNHLPYNGLLGNKKAMFYMLREYYRLTSQNIFSVVPLTFHIRKGFVDQQFKLFTTKFFQNRIIGLPNYWILKPGEFSNRGQGIGCTNQLEVIKNRLTKIKNYKNKSLIIQQYITNPLLYNGRKFDIRTYLLLTVNNGRLRGYWYQDGYVRTSSYLWNLEDIGDNEVHLTNDAIQKYCINYGKYEAGNKLTYTELQRYFDTLPRPINSSPCSFQKDIYPKLKDIATDAIKSSFCYIDPERKGNNFQIFGFDFMIDSHYKPWLIEINTNPCLEMNCPVLNRIMPSMVENAFRIGLDPIFPPPMNFSSTFKYSIPENALHYNKFELIFDEERDGPSLVEMYMESTVIKEMDEYEQDKEIYEEQGEEIDLQQT